MAIQHVSLREANQRFSKYIEMASHGAEIIVTKRGRPVARIAPIEVGGRMSEAEKAALERSPRHWGSFFMSPEKTECSLKTPLNRCTTGWCFSRQ